MGWNEMDIPRQTGRLAIITGTGGLGYEAARALTAAGASVILAGRNAQKGHDAVTRIRKIVPGADIVFEVLDLADLSSVAAFADRMMVVDRQIDLLVNNAGVAIVPKRQATKDGFELQFGTNHLGHFALTMRLMPLLLRASAPRVVNMSSSTHKIGKLDFDDLQWEKSYSPSGAYGRSKLATLMFSLELDRRAQAAGLPLIVTAAHPGIARTELMNNGPAGQPILQTISHAIEWVFGQSAAAGTLPLLRAATDPNLRGGEYLGPTGCLGMKGAPGIVPPSDKASDHETAGRLWEVSARLTGTDLPG